MSIRREQYVTHLESQDWKEQREYALHRTSGLCQFCGDFATQVHHVIYPKQFGDEHPNSLIPVCDDCHKVSHGVQKMKKITEAEKMSDLSPAGTKWKYLISDGRVYASAESWIKALQVPVCLTEWFKSNLSRNAMLKKNDAGGELEMEYLNTAVYRWPAVAEVLRVFDRNWYTDGYKKQSRFEEQQINRFHENYERLVAWGYDLQERALNTILNAPRTSNQPVTQDELIGAIKEAVAPRLLQHDSKLHEHDVIIEELVDSIPSMRDQDEFIVVKQAIAEQGLDGTIMPLYPKSKENLSSLVGQTLKKKNAEQGSSKVSRLDGMSVAAEMNTYRRGAIYVVLKEMQSQEQYSLLD